MKPYIALPLLLLSWAFTIQNVVAQSSNTNENRLKLAVQPELISLFHPFETAWGGGGNLALENKMWSVGLSAYRFVNSIDSDPAPVMQLSPTNLVVTEDHYNDIYLFGVHLARTVRVMPSFKIRIGLTAGAISLERRLEAYEFIAFDSDGTPLNLGDISIGRDVPGYLEPFLRAEKNLSGKWHLGMDAGYLFSTANQMGQDFKFNGFSLKIGLCYSLF